MLAHDVQLEIEVDNLAQLESFWGQIPPQAHKAWGQRAQVQHSRHHSQLDGAAAMSGLQESGYLLDLSCMRHGCQPVLLM